MRACKQSTSLRHAHRAGGALYLWHLSRELALTCGSVTLLLWAAALKYGAFTRRAQRAYQDGLAETNQARAPLPPSRSLHPREQHRSPWSRTGRGRNIQLSCDSPAGAGEGTSLHSGFRA